MNKCLVTTLKAQTNNEALSKYNVLTIKNKSIDSPTLDTQWFNIGASGKGSISINSSSVGLYKSGISGELLPYPITLEANLSVGSHVENKDGIIEVTGKYNLGGIQVSNTVTLRIKEIYGIPGTLRTLSIDNIEEGEIDIAKLKNALNVGGTKILDLPLNVNYLNKLGKNVLSELTSIEQIGDGFLLLFDDNIGLDDLANNTTIKLISGSMLKPGNLSSLAKLVNLTTFYFNVRVQNSGDIMDFINPWIQAGRTSGKVKMPGLSLQKNVTLNGQPISSISGDTGRYYLNWISDGTVTFTAS